MGHKCFAHNQSFDQHPQLMQRKKHSIESYINSHITYIKFKIQFRILNPQYLTSIVKILMKGFPNISSNDFLKMA